VEIGEENVVTFNFELAGEAENEFTVAATKCNNDGAYSIASVDSVTNMSVKFMNDESIVNAVFCAKVVLTWNNGVQIQDVASLTFEMEVEATSSGTQIVETDTPATSFQVVENDQEAQMEVSVVRSAPAVELAVTNPGPIFYGEDVMIVATSPNAGYHFKLTGAATQSSSGTPHDLNIVDAGPGESGVVFAVNGFRIQDFSGTSITITLEIAWDVNGFDDTDPNQRQRRRAQPRVRHGGHTQYELEIHVILPEETSAATCIVVAWSTMIVAAVIFF
jgi:hypothetical protein